MNRFAAIARTLAGLGSWRRAGLLLLAGGLAGLAMPPFNFWWLLFAAFPLLIWIIAEAPPRRAFFLGWLFGLGYFAVCFYWIGIAFMVDAATYLWMMPFMVGALAGGMALYWGLAAFATALSRQKGLARLIAFAVFLAVAEWLRGRLLTGFPWTAPGLAANGMGGLAQAASLIGMPGLTLLIAMWASLPALLGFTGRRRGEVVAALALLALLPALWLWGAYRLAEVEARPAEAVSLRIVQPNIAQDDKWRGDNARPIFDKMKIMSQTPTAERPNGMDGLSVVIWPESALSFPVDESPQALSELADLLPDGTALVLGALRRDPQDQAEGGERRVYNSVLGLDSAANILARYDKWRLVPGGEFLPFESILEPLGFRKVVTVPGSFTPGPGPRNISLPGLPLAAVLICYEAIFPHQLLDPAQRPDWIINVTNDGWFGESSGPYQHLAQARLRAIEQGLPLVRAANTGISAIIDAKGRVEAELGLGAEGVIDGSLPPAISATIYARAGDWTLLGLLFLLSAVGFAVRRPRATS